MPLFKRKKTEGSPNRACIHALVALGIRAQRSSDCWCRTPDWGPPPMALADTLAMV